MDSRLADKFVVRMPDGMRDRIAEVSKAARRSMNSEIVHRLERSLSDDQTLAQQQQMIDQLSSRIRELEARP